MLRRVLVLGALVALASSPVTANEPDQKAEAVLASWCKDRAPTGYEVLDCGPCPGPKYVLRWVEERWTETVYVAVCTPTTEKKVVQTFERQNVTRKENVTTFVPVERREIATKDVCVPQQKVVDVPVTRYQTHTECINVQVPVTRIYRWVECEPLACNPCWSVPKVHCERVTEMECRTKQVTTRVPVTEYQRRCVTEWQKQTVTYERTRTDYERRTELRDVTRSECVPVQKEVTVHGQSVQWVPKQVTRCCLRPVWTLVDECGMPLAAPPQQSAPPAPAAPAKTMARESREAPTASLAVYKKTRE